MALVFKRINLKIKASFGSEEINMFAPQDKFITDYWIFKEGTEYHLFHLQAPRALIDPDKRHDNHSIGHAVSTDLKNWTSLPDALLPDPSLPHEGNSIATGSVVKRDDTYFMLYVGCGNMGHCICLATSKDLIKWRKHPGNPVLKKDSRYYDPDGCWADPFIVKNPDGDGYHIFFKAHDKSKPKGYRGAIGAAFSKDFINWEVLPPVFSSGLLLEPEVPAVYHLDGKYYLIMMTIPPVVTDLYEKKIHPAKPQWGDIYVVSDNLLGPYGPQEGIQLTKTKDEMMMVRLVEDPQGGLNALSWWQGYEWYWKDWIKTHEMKSPSCILNDPRPVKLEFSKKLGFKKILINQK